MKIFFIITLIFFIHIKTNACDCIGQYSVKKEIKNSDLVITGKVINKEIFFFRDSLTGIKIYMVKFNIEVENKYKGKFKSKLIQIYTGLGKGDCGFEFEVGQKYIIYATYKHHYYTQIKKIPKYFYTDICSRTCKINSNEIYEIEKRLRKKYW